MKSVIAFASLLLLLMWVAPEASACDCRPPTPEVSYEKSGAVFVGEFVGFSTRLFHGKRVDARKFKVKKAWKGGLVGTIVLPYADIPGSCGDLKLTKGQEYLLYVSSWKGELFLDVDCARSRNVKDAAEDLRYLERLSGSLNAPPNNGMHPTADTTAFIFGNLVGRRVMPGVRRYGR